MSAKVVTLAAYRRPLLVERTVKIRGASVELSREGCLELAEAMAWVMQVGGTKRAAGLAVSKAKGCVVLGLEGNSGSIALSLAGIWIRELHSLSTAKAASR